MRVCYVAHPVGAETVEGVDENIARAKRWYRWLCENFPDLALVANWIVDVEVYSGSDAGAQRHENAKRIKGLERDDAVIAVCGEMILCGGSVSPGMARGINTATQHFLTLYDLTDLGLEPPTGPVDLDEYLVAAR